jgi:hypothetical protein
VLLHLALAFTLVLVLVLATIVFAGHLRLLLSNVPLKHGAAASCEGIASTGEMGQGFLGRSELEGSIAAEG